jgi:hypothetical protein
MAAITNWYSETAMERRPRKCLTAPILESGKPGSLVLDNYIINELFLREDFPQYFTEEERTYEAIVEAARKRREADEREMAPGA